MVVTAAKVSVLNTGFSVCMGGSSRKMLGMSSYSVELFVGTCLVLVPWGLRKYAFFVKIFSIFDFSLRFYYGFTKDVAHKTHEPHP